MRRLSFFKKNLKGFTVIELSLTIGIFMILMTIISLNVRNVQFKTSMSTTIEKLIGDMKAQQTKAMSGDTEGRSTSDNYGIYFQAGSYVLFHGSAYSSGDATNFTISLDPNFQFTNILFPSSSLIFLRVSGEMSGFAVGSNTITIRNISSGEQKTITINRFGIITQVN